MRAVRAFTLVEILIVVVILGILSAIVVPQFSSATLDAEKTATYDQLLKVRNAISVYFLRNASQFPTITQGSGSQGCWGQLISSGDYLRQAPLNQWVGGTGADMITIGTSPDSAYQSSYGWIYNPQTGDLWAASYDGNDQPYPKAP